MVFIVYIAGFVTTVNLIGNGVVALLTPPGAARALQGRSLAGQQRGRGDAALLGSGRIDRCRARRRRM